VDSRTSSTPPGALRISLDDWPRTHILVGSNEATGEGRKKSPLHSSPTTNVNFKSDPIPPLRTSALSLNAATTFIHRRRLSSKMSAAQLLNPKAESRVRSFARPSDAHRSRETFALLTLSNNRGGARLSRSTSAQLRVCRMSSSPTSDPRAR
jgi:hypothetical protein